MAGVVLELEKLVAGDTGEEKAMKPTTTDECRIGHSLKCSSR